MNHAEAVALEALKSDVSALKEAVAAILARLEAIEAKKSTTLSLPKK